MITDLLVGILTAIVVATVVGALLALLRVSAARKEPIPWGEMWRALTRRRRGGAR